jgi:hypothetical protein
VKIVVAQLMPQPHPIVACAEQVCALMGEVAGVQPLYMSIADKQAALLALTMAERRVAELKLRVMAAADDVADADGSRDVAAWMASRTRADTAAVRVEQTLAQSLDKRWGRVAAGMAAGEVSVEQARVIATGLEGLPARIGAEVLADAEARLVVYAQTCRPSELRRLTRRILELVAPEIADAEEAKRLENEEQRALETCRLTLNATGEGSTRLSGLIPDADAARLRTYLEAFTSPRKHQDAITGEEDRIPYRRQLGHAFCALLEHLDPAKLPAHGGDATTVMVTIDLESLTKDLATGAVIGGEPLSATAIRRLACTANIIPAVLGGNGEILDLGRSQRLFTPAQRKAMRLRDQHCRAEGCTIPATWTEAHHLKPWSEGGNTDLADGLLLCNWHHHRIHDPRFATDTLPTGDIRFHRRT